MSSSHISVSSASSEPSSANPPSPPHESDSDFIPSDVRLDSETGSTDQSKESAEPSQKRKRGRPRKYMSLGEKAPMESDAPKNKRGRPPKQPIEAAGTSTSSNPTPQMVTSAQFQAANWDHYSRSMLQNTRLDALESGLAEIKGTLAYQQLEFENLHNSIQEVINFLEAYFGFKPWAPPPL